MTDSDAQGTTTDLITVLMRELAAPPAPAERAMALVVSSAGGGDHLGLLVRGQLNPGVIDLLASVISARVRPRAAILLEWTLAGEPQLRHYRGWTAWREGDLLAWRRLSSTEVRAQHGLRAGQPLADDPLARFDP